MGDGPLLVVELALTLVAARYVATALARRVVTLTARYVAVRITVRRVPVRRTARVRAGEAGALGIVLVGLVGAAPLLTRVLRLDLGGGLALYGAVALLMLLALVVALARRAA
jgi:hypothetical protein